MKQKEAEAIFFEKDVLPLHARYLKQMAEALVNEPERCLPVFVSCVDKAGEMTNAAGFDMVFLVFTLLRTELLENRGRFLVRAYDKSWYFGESMDLFWLEAGGIYRYFFQFWEEAKKASHHFMGKIPEITVQHMVMDLVMEYHTLLASFLNKDGFLKGYGTGVEIYIGEYMGALQRLGGDGTDGIFLGEGGS